MTPKSKGEFLFELHNELHRIGIDADDEIFADFEEHFNEGMEQGIPEEETCRRLGDPKEIARNYLEIRSSRINSLVADAIEANKPHVSLTKPGRNTPADISLAKPEPIREVTPEHIMTEEEAQALAAASRSAAAAAPIREVTPEHIAAEPEPAQKPSDILNSFLDEHKQSQTVREVTPEHIAAEETPQPEASQSAPQPEAPQSIPSPSNEREQDNSAERQGYVPPQSCKQVGDNGGMLDWAQLKGRKTNVNMSKLIPQLILDCCVFTWLIPTLASIAFGVGSGGVAVISSGVGALFGATAYVFMSRIFLAIGLVSLGCIMILGAACIIKGIVKIIKKLIENHIKAIYDL